MEGVNNFRRSHALGIQHICLKDHREALSIDFLLIVIDLVLKVSVCHVTPI